MMKTSKFFSLFIFILFAQTSFAEAPLLKEDEKKIPANQKATFPGGTEFLIQYVQHNLAYPYEARENGVEGKVVMEFVVTRNGKIKKIKLIEGVDSQLNKEAYRLIENMPKWIPAKKESRLVKTVVTMPIRFALE